jgi:hypothetical protein
MGIKRPGRSKCGRCARSGKVVVESDPDDEVYNPDGTPVDDDDYDGLAI